jgi:hypothetical protein
VTTILYLFVWKHMRVRLSCKMKTSAPEDTVFIEIDAFCSKEEVTLQEK